MTHWNTKEGVTFLSSTHKINSLHLSSGKETAFVGNCLGIVHSLFPSALKDLFPFGQA